MQEEASVAAENVAVEQTASVQEGGLSLEYFKDFDFSSAASSLEDLLKAGVHFGHVSSREHPKMKQFVFTTRKNLSVLDLEKTASGLKEACEFLEGVAKSGKPILFIGIKKQTHDLVRSLAGRLGMPYVVDRWLGGTFTNFSIITSRAKYLCESQEKFESGEFKKYTKFEQTKKAEEIEKLERKMGGIKRMKELPGAVVIVDVREADIVVREAKRVGIPIVGIVDSNADPSNVDYPIPGNDDALSSLRLLLGVLGKSIEGAKKAEVKVEA